MQTVTSDELQTLSKSKLLRLVNHGILVVVNTSGAPVAASRIDETPEYQQFAHLRGQPIHIREASRKYDVPDRTIGRWAKKGYIPTLGQDKNRVLLDESYVAYCVDVWKKNQGSGRWIFDENGLPYDPKNKP